MMWQIVVDDPKRLKKIKNALENAKAFVKPMESVTIDDVQYKIIKSNFKDLKMLQKLLPEETNFQEYNENDDKENGDVKHKMNHDLVSLVKSILLEMNKPIELINDILEHVPTRFTIYSPVMLLNNSTVRTFAHECFQKLTQDELNLIFDKMIEQYKIEIIAINKPIEEEDLMRQPHNLQILHHQGNDSDIKIDDIWCKVKQNGIWQIWNPMFTMFSRGNIKEKKRILDTYPDVKGNDIVDLYCGIGYFTFSYLKLQCKNIFGFELNEWSVLGLQKGLVANKYFDNHDGIHIYNENNEKSVERIQEFRLKENDNKLLNIRHINLGLLPSSQQGYPLALEILLQHNDWLQTPLSTLHIHENVHIDDIQNGEFAQLVVTNLEQSIPVEKVDGDSRSWSFTVVYLEQIKTFAPDVWHVCIDVNVQLV